MLLPTVAAAVIVGTAAAVIGDVDAVYADAAAFIVAVVVVATVDVAAA